MRDAIAPAIVEGVRLIASAQKDKAYYDYRKSANNIAPTQIVSKPASWNEEIVPGVELNNYTTRSEVDGEDNYVLIVDHSERLEKKKMPPVPPTAEELAEAAADKAEEREQKKFMAKLWAGVSAVGIVVVGVVVAMDHRNNRVVGLGLAERDENEV